MKITVDTSALKLIERTKELQQIALATIAEVAKTRLNKQKPPEPTSGSMRWVSDKQERFVKKMFAMKRMNKYIRGRGNGLPWQRSQRLNNSYVIMREQIGEASIVSTASYARYVIGGDQSQIHQGRWPTAADVADEMRADGTMEKIIRDAFNTAFGK